MYDLAFDRTLTHVFHWWCPFTSGNFYRGAMSSADLSIRVTTRAFYLLTQQIPLPLLSLTWLLVPVLWWVKVHYTVSFALSFWLKSRPKQTCDLNCFISQVNQSRQGNSGSYNTYSEYDSANHGQHFNDNFNMQQPIQGNLGSFNHIFEYDSANQGQQLDGNMIEGYSESLNPFPEYDPANYGQWSSLYSNLQQPVPYSAPFEDELEKIWKPQIEENYDSLGEERTSMQQHYSDYRPKRPVTGVLADDSSDNDSVVSTSHL